MTTFKTIDGRNKIKSLLNEANITYDLNGTDTPVPIVFPNIDASEDLRPRIEVMHVMSIQTDGTLAGGQRLEERGVYDFTVVVKYGTGEELAATIADKIRAVFPAGSYITIPNAVIQFPEIPSVGNIVSMEGDARLFMTLQYIVTSSL